MRYIPHTPEDVAAMCAAAGVASVDALFEQVPAPLRLKGPLTLPPALDEIELMDELDVMAARNAHPGSHLLFLGAGAYPHFIPSAVPYVVSRAEFQTCYTPYQPEISQGTTTAIFEWQTLIARLTAMPLANASLYDGGHATAEAVLMALRVARGKRTRVVLSRGVHPEYRETVRTYVGGLDVEVVEVGWSEAGTIDLAQLAKAVDGNTAAVVVGYPNFFGAVEPLAEIDAVCKAAGAPWIAAVAEPVSLGLLTPPGAFGAFVVCGEGQPLGVPVSFGGPGVGFFAARREHLRQLPGRLAGRAQDADGRTGYVLTLSTREQHIRREKATSNVCTNQGLMMLMATVWMSLVGKQGLAAIARRNLAARAFAAETLAKVPGAKLKFAAPGFNELVLDVGRSAQPVHDALVSRGIVAGLPLGRFYPELDRTLLLCFTELTRKAHIEKLAAALGEVLS